MLFFKEKSLRDTEALVLVSGKQARRLKWEYITSEQVVNECVNACNGPMVLGIQDLTGPNSWRAFHLNEHSASITGGDRAWGYACGPKARPLKCL